MLRCLPFSESLDGLMASPGRGGVLSHVEVQHLATTVLQYYEQLQNLHRDRGHCEEVHRDHLAEVVVQEHFPGSAGWPQQFPEDSGDVRSETSMPSIFNSP